MLTLLRQVPYYILNVVVTKLQKIHLSFNYLCFGSEGERISANGEKEFLIPYGNNPHFMTEQGLIHIRYDFIYVPLFLGGFIYTLYTIDRHYEKNNARAKLKAQQEKATALAAKEEAKAQKSKEKKETKTKQQLENETKFRAKVLEIEQTVKPLTEIKYQNEKLHTEFTGLNNKLAITKQAIKNFSRTSLQKMFIECQTMLTTKSFSEKMAKRIKEKDYYHINFAYLPGKMVNGNYILRTDSDAINDKTLTFLFKSIKFHIHSAINCQNAFSVKYHQRCETLAEYQKLLSELKSIQEAYLKHLEKIKFLYQNLDTIQNYIKEQHRFLTSILSKESNANKDEKMAREKKRLKDLFQPESKKTAAERKKERNDKLKLNLKLRILKPFSKSNILEDEHFSSADNEAQVKSNKERMDGKNQKEKVAYIPNKKSPPLKPAAGERETKLTGDRDTLKPLKLDNTLESIKIYINTMHDIINTLIDEETRAAMAKAGQECFDRERKNNAYLTVTTDLKDSTESKALVELKMLTEDEQMSSNATMTITRTAGLERLGAELKMSDELFRFLIKSENLALLYLTASSMDKIRTQRYKLLFPRILAKIFRHSTYHNPEFRSDLANDKNPKLQMAQREYMRHLALELIAYLRNRLSNDPMSKNEAENAIAYLQSLMLKGHDHHIAKRGRIKNTRKACKSTMTECLEYLNETDSQRNEFYTLLESELATYAKFSKPLCKLIVEYSDVRLSPFLGEKLNLILDNACALMLSELAAYFTEFRRRFRNDREYPYFANAVAKYDTNFANQLRHADASVSLINQHAQLPQFSLHNSAEKRRSPTSTGVDHSLTSYRKIKNLNGSS